MKPDFVKKLSAIVGPDKVSVAPDVLAAHAADRWFASRRPDIVVFPESTGDVAAVMRFANRRGIPVTARGAGVGYVGGCVPSMGGIVLSLARMNRIKEIAVPDGVAVVEPGVITGVLRERAAKVGLCYPPDPASLADSSIGGNIATNAGGPRCLKYGVTRQYVLGLEVVLAGGRILRAGGRTLKNKTGFDLAGLFVGSEGLLGIVTEATVRLIPLPPARAGLSVAFPRFAQAAAGVQAILAAGHLPAAIEIADQFTLQAARKHLGKTLVPSGAAHLLLEIDGQPEAVAIELRKLRRLLAGMGARQVRVAPDAATCDRLWDLRRGFSDSLKATGLTKLNEDIVVPRGRLVDLVMFCRRLAKKHGYPVACFGHAGDGNIHVNVMAARYHDDPKVAARVRVALDELFHQVLDWGGAITGEHGIGIAKQRWWKDAVSPVCRRVHEEIKLALDPKGILNPGKFVGPRT